MARDTNRKPNIADLLIGASSRRLDEDRDRLARQMAGALSVLATDEGAFSAALFACDDEASNEPPVPDPGARLNAATIDVSRATVLDERLARDMKRWLIAETEWARDRVKGLRFSSAETLFGFLYQACEEERPDLLPWSVTAVTRLMLIAQSLHYADMGEQLRRERAS